MPHSLESILRYECKLDKDRRILVGVSGGPDSLCLLSLLHETGWRVVAGHFDHMLRPEAAEESEAVQQLAGQLGIPFVGGRGDVRGYALAEKLSIESAARELRYRFLFTQARVYEAQAVAVGHTADDQVETVLMHLIRGAGLKGLKGMPYCTLLQEFDSEVPLVRPLLNMWRSETVAYCEARGLKAHYDLSNDSQDFLRNRVRHELIPLLEMYNPQFRQALWRSGKTLSADYELLSAALEPVWKQALARQAGKYIGLHANVISEQPAGVQMHLFRRAAQSLIPGYDMGYADLQRAAQFAAHTAQQRTDFAGSLMLVRESNMLYVTESEADLPSDQWPQMQVGVKSITLSETARVALADGWQFTLDRCSRAELGSMPPWDELDLFLAVLDAGNLPGQLELRVRRAGDRLVPLGMAGHSQKLSDLFINARLPARARRRWPLVCAGEQVIWVPGYRPADSHRLRPDSGMVLRLAVVRPG